MLTETLYKLLHEHMCCKAQFIYLYPFWSLILDRVPTQLSTQNFMVFPCILFILKSDFRKGSDPSLQSSVLRIQCSYISESS